MSRTRQFDFATIVVAVLLPSVCLAEATQTITTPAPPKSVETSFPKPLVAVTGNDYEPDTSGTPSTTPAPAPAAETAEPNTIAGVPEYVDYGNEQSGGLELFGFDFSGDHEFDNFIEPVTNPVYAMDPRSRTRLRTIFLNQTLPDDSILGGGDYQVYAAQLSFALSDRLAFIAQKDGYITLQADGLKHRDGFGDMAAGLKYTMIRDTESRFLLSGGFMLETSSGSGDVFQGNGSGQWTFFMTMGKEFGECGECHLVSTIGWNLPIDDTQESEAFYYSVHFDRRMVGNFYLLWELNGFQYTANGGRLPVNVEGGDLINLGATDVDGNSFITTAFGAAWKINPNLELAAAWEFPISKAKDLMENRANVTLSWSF